ncbi:MAG: hypothetical protein J5546_05805 [Lachnospiraceae bacterium]|nr:hypothetical protein [Lachnospiraceae bacterium]
MKLIRLISGESAKGTKHYLKTQKGYEIAKTLVLYALSAALFFAGWFTTKTRLNLLTIVAVLGILPATKSLVVTIMFCIAKGLKDEDASAIEAHTDGLSCLYDLFFTSNEKNHTVGHLTVKGNTVCGYTADPKFDEAAFSKHIDQRLKADQLKNVNVKVFTDLSKYLDRLDQMRELSCDESRTQQIIETIKSITL